MFILMSAWMNGKILMKRGLKHLNDLKAFIEYSNDMDNIKKDIEEYNPNKIIDCVWWYDCWYT